MANSERVLLYTPKPLEQVGKLQAALAVLRIPVKTLGPQSAGEIVGRLAGLKEPPSDTAEEAPTPDGPMLVFCGLSSQRLDQVLAKLRACGGPAIPHKAVLTHHNSGWTLAQLYAELCRERAEIAAQLEK